MSKTTLKREPATNKELRKIAKARQLSRKFIAELCEAGSVSTVDRWLAPYKKKTAAGDWYRNPTFRSMPSTALFTLKTKLGIVDQGEAHPRLKH